MAEHDLVIRGGTVIDGTGAPRRTADIAVSDGIVTDVDRVDGAGRREIDADGALVTPGFVDIHCHYDGQATWDERLHPSSWHGVTTVVMGNCGVGFAPVHDRDRERLIQLMEGVEDIPGAALAEGLRWGWNDFAGFLDAVDARPHDLDVAAQVWRSTGPRCTMTSPQAAGASCNGPVATGIRWWPASRPTPTVRPPAHCPAASCAAPSRRRPDLA
jgi:N-acyl-D-aspartate/D-glutamate deacylase